MKKSGAIFILLIISILIISSVNFVSANEEDCSNSLDDDEDGSTDCDDDDCAYTVTCIPCTDSDSGLDYYTSGVATGIYAGGLSSKHFVYGDGDVQVFDGPGESVYYDHCANSVQLNEGFCSSDGRLSAMANICPNGCEDGACIEEVICRNENYACTVEDIPCCEGLKETPLASPGSDGECVGATCGSICRPCGNGVCDENENICNCPEDCKTEIQCGEGIAECLSEETMYCEDSNACTRTTKYECIEGKCIASGGESGCNPCSYGCKDGACLTSPDPEPRPGTCAAKITISFNKNVYYIGDEFKVELGVFDSQGNPIPNYPFYIKIYDYEKGIWHPSFEEDSTDGTGYKIHQDKMNIGEPFRFGKNKLKIYTNIGECNLVEDTVIIEIKRKEESDPVPCGMGKCVPEPEPIDDEPTNISDERGFYSCSGCEVDDKCYPMGYRKERGYCSDDNEFIDQLKTGTCDNSFECTSNLCISGECLTESFIQKIIDWLKAFFGMEPKPPIEKACSKLLLEHNIGEYKYEKSVHGEDKHTQAPLFSEDGEHLDTIKCCAALYKDKEDIEHGVLFCPYDSKKDVTNSVKWIIAKERDIVFKEFRNEKVFGDDKGRIVAWTNNAYLIAVGVGPAEKNVPLPEDLAEAYLKKYPSEFELTEDDIPDAPPGRPWVYCTEEDEEAGNKCESQPGARLQTDPNPEDKSCEVYVGCILPHEKCENIDDIKEREDCYVSAAEMTGDDSVCEKITSDESRKNKCYVKAAERSKDASICEKITEDDIKEMCFELVKVEPDYKKRYNPAIVQNQEWYSKFNSEGLSDEFIFSGEQIKGDIKLNIIQGRGYVSIDQYPTESNDFETIILFDDDEFGNPDYYEINVLDNTGRVIFTFEDCIDGSDYLIIKDNTVKYEHRNYQNPGEHEACRHIVSWVTCKSEEDISAEKCHFTDDFENGLEKWVFSSKGAGSEVVEDGNTVLRLIGVERANVHRIWDNYLFKFRFKMIDGSVHVDFRRSEGHEFGAKRYFVAIATREIYWLSKQVHNEWRELVDISLGIDSGWHDLEIRCYDNIINVYIDNELVAKYKDTMDPLLSGWIRFEAHTGGDSRTIPELLIDDVEIKLITEEDIIYP